MVLVSVIIPVYNGGNTLTACLRALTAQSLPRDQFEIIVVDDGSQDNSVSIARQFNVQCVTLTHRSAPIARNAGARLSRGQWIAFTDHDCLPSQHWLKTLLAICTSSENTWGAAGKTLGYESRSDAARFVDLTGGLDAEKYLTHSAHPWAPACNVIYRRSIFEAIGRFDERYLNYEYCDLHLRMRHHSDWVFKHEPRALVLHRHRSTWRQYWHQQFFYGRGYGQFLWNYRDQFHWEPWREVKAWGQLVGLAIRAAWPGQDDRSIVRCGLFIKQFAQHLGFISTYYNRAERARWLNQSTASLVTSGG